MLCIVLTDGLFKYVQVPALSKETTTVHDMPEQTELLFKNQITQQI